MIFNAVYFGAFSIWPEGIVIILAIVLLFGGRKIPELMKGLGQGMKEFKKARKENDQDEEKDNPVE